MSGTVSLPACPVCGQPGATLRFLKDGVPYHRCAGCAFCFAIPQSNPNLENAFEDFEPAYLQYLQADAADAVNMAKRWEWIRRFGVGASGVTLLDVGCGSGKWVRYLRRVKVEAYGLEPNAALVERFLPEREWFTHGEVTQENAATARRYQVVTAFDVLEHVADPMSFLRRIVDLTLPGGRVFLSLPDVACASARLMGRSWYFYNPYHLSYFSPATLARAARDVGLSVVHVSHRGRYRSVGYALRYAFEYLLRRRPPAIWGFLDRWYVPLNVYDTMFLCLRKQDTAGAPARAAS